MRHGKRIKKDGESVCALDAPLSEEGAAEIGKIAERKLAGRKFAILKCSPVLRALQTAQIAVPGANWIEDECLGFRVPEVWDFIYPHREEMPPEIWRKILEDLAQIEVEKMLSLVEETIFELADGENALFVTHQPAFGKLGRLFFDGFPDDAWETMPEGSIYRLMFKVTSVDMGLYNPIGHEIL